MKEPHGTVLLPKPARGFIITRLSSLASRRFAVIVGVAVAVLSPQIAWGQSVSNCAATDNPYGVALNCSSVCTISGSEVDCTTATKCSGGAGDGVNATMVQDFNATGNHDFEIFGVCNLSGRFCCAIDDTANGTLTKLELIGTAYGDDLQLQGTNGNRMRNHRTYHVDGFIRGGDDSDTILGSSFSGSNYRDNLYGEGGGDFMNGGADGDWMDGGPGDDAMSGNYGDDAMIGGDGNDFLEGGDGHDTVCDSAENSDATCVFAFGTELHGDADNDIVYYEVTAMCNQAPNGASDCRGANNDFWGNNGMNPADCEHSLFVWPAACVDPN